MNLQQLPKVELHLHLDCSLSYEVVQKIDPTITEEVYARDFIAPAKCTDLADFLTRAVKGFSLMQTKEQLQLVVHDLFKQLAADNMLYAEIRFAPLLHIEKGLTAYEVVAATEAALANAVKETDIEARLILCTLRHHTEAQSMETVKLAEQFKGTYVAAFDIAGDEAGFPVDAHIKAFQYAREKNIPVTAHAGEAKGAESVWETLKAFSPSRIGHGVRSAEDEKLVAHLRDNNIHLEICPTCNVQINIYDRLRDHPIDKLYRAGVSLNVNTDCRTITNISLNREYENLQREFGWTKAHFYQCNVNALKAAFIPEAVKEKLLVLLDKGYDRYL
jgi:adenosine deaminase